MLDTVMWLTHWQHCISYETKLYNNHICRFYTVFVWYNVYQYTTIKYDNHITTHDIIQYCVIYDISNDTL